MVYVCVDFCAGCCLLLIGRKFKVPVAIMSFRRFIIYFALLNILRRRRVQYMSRLKTSKLLIRMFN